MKATLKFAAVGRLPPVESDPLHGLIWSSSFWLERSPSTKVLNPASPITCHRQLSDWRESGVKWNPTRSPACGDLGVVVGAAGLGVGAGAATGLGVGTEVGVAAWALGAGVRVEVDGTVGVIRLLS